MSKPGLSVVKRLPSRPWSGFRVRVLVLCMLAVIPIVMMEVYSAHDDTERSIAALQSRADQMVDTANEQYDDMMLQAQIVLDFVATAPETSGTTDECGVFTDKIKARYKWVTGLGTTGIDGMATCGEAARQHLSISDKPYFQQALATKRMTFSDFHIGRISHKPVLTVLKPILDDKGTVIRLGILAIDLKEFNDFLARKKLADDVCVTIFDSAGTVLGRYPEAAKFTGQNTNFHPLTQAVLAKHSGEFEGQGLDQIQRFYSFRPFWGNSTFIAVGILEQPVLDRIHERLALNVLTVLITVLAAALIGLVAAEIMVFKPTKRLTLAARSLGEGKFEELPDLTASMPEMAEMLVAFHEMAQHLHRREEDLKRVESETRSVNRNLMLGEQIANAGYWRVDFPGEKVTWSDGSYRIFGFNPADYKVSLASALSLYHPDDRKFVSETIEMAVNLQRDFEYTARITRVDGELRYIMSRGFCEIGANGMVQALFGAVIDVTMQKETEARLHAARQAAEAASRAKSDFLSSMSHELRTPLTSIIGFSDLLLMRSKSTETRRYLKLQREAGQHLLTLISDILDHSKIEAGKLQLESIPFDLRAMVDSCIGVMTNEAQRKGLKLDSVVSIAVPQTMVGDPNRLKQVLLNLVSNAIKFTTSGGITVEIEPTGTAGDVVALRFAVNDTGCGIARNKLPRLFQRFSQAEASTTRQFGGTGLGLAISKELVEAMGGTIGADSTLGRGSSFWFNIRLLTAPDSKTSDHRKAKAAAHRSRILLAEDSPVNQLLFTELLETLGHEVIAVNDGAAAFEAILSGGIFDLVLMDMQMPVMDGLTATRRIREAGYKDLPIIGLTANAMQEDIDRCIAAGMNAHLSKPVDLAMLIEAIDHVMAS